MSQSKEEVSEIVQNKVRRRVGLHALREIRRVVDRWQEEEKASKKLWHYTLIGLFLVLIGLYFWVYTHPTTVRVIGGSNINRSN